MILATWFVITLGCSVQSWGGVYLSDGAGWSEHAATGCTVQRVDQFKDRAAMAKTLEKYASEDSEIGHGIGTAPFRFALDVASGKAYPITFSWSYKSVPETRSVPDKPTLVLEGEPIR